MFVLLRCAVVTYVSEESASAAVNASADDSQLLHLHHRSAHPSHASVCLSVCRPVYLPLCLSLWFTHVHGICIIMSHRMSKTEICFVCLCIRKKLL